MTHNRGATTLKTRRRRTDPMQDYDRLPKALRDWVALAALPWSASSVRRAFGKALSETGDTARALAALDQIEGRLIARDARRVWGEGHPQAVAGDARAGSRGRTL